MGAPLRPLRIYEDLLKLQEKVVNDHCYYELTLCQLFL